MVVNDGYVMVSGVNFKGFVRASGDKVGLCDCDG